MSDVAEALPRIEPEDTPEGRVLVLVSATLFKQLLPADARIVSWGSPYTAEVTWYEPFVIKDEVPA